MEEITKNKGKKARKYRFLFRFIQKTIVLVFEPLCSADIYISDISNDWK